MKLPTKMKTVVLAILAIVMPLTSLSFAESNDALLKMLPGNALFCVRINQFNASLGKMDQYLTGASPIPMSIAMLANMQLAGILGDPTLAGIDQNGTFMIVGIALEDNQVDMSILAPMTDYEAFTKNNAACSPSGTDGVLLFKAPNSPAGTLAITPVPGGKYVLVNSEENIGAMVTLQKQLAATGPKLAAALDADQSAQAASSPAWAYVNLGRLYELYGTQMLEGINEMQQEMPKDAAMGEAMEMNIRMMTAMVKTYFSQTDSLTLALLPEPAVLNMDFSFKAKDGSKMAGMLTANPQTETGFKLARFAEDNDAVNMVLRMDPPVIEKFYAELLDMMNTTLSDKFPAQEMEQLKALVDKSLKAMGKEAFISFSYEAGQPPFKMREVFAVTEPDFFKTNAPEGITAANSFYKALDLPVTLSFQPGVETYKNVSIDAVALKFAAADSNDLAMQEVAKLYGPDGFAYYTAQKDNLAFVALGPDSKTVLKTLIDTPADKVATGDLQKAMTILGPDAQRADIVGSVNYLKLFKGGMGVVSQMSGAGAETGGMLSEMAKAMDVPTQSCMAISATVGKGKINSRLALPKQHLMEIITAAMQVQQKMMQQQQQMQQQQGAQPAVGMSGAPQSAEPASTLQPQPVQPAAERKDPLQEWVGKPAPDLKMTDLQGNALTLSGLKGKKVMVDLWATWCPPCKEMIPSLIDLRNGTKPEQLAILAISNEPVDRLNKFAKDYKLNYTVIPSGSVMPSPYGSAAVLPTTFLIDSSGTIRHVLVGSHEPADLKAAIDSMQ